MAERKVVLLRIHPGQYEALRRWAADEFRSVNGQIEYLLHQALHRGGRQPRGSGPDRDGGAGEERGTDPGEERGTGAD